MLNSFTKPFSFYILDQSKTDTWYSYNIFSWTFFSIFFQTISFAALSFATVIPQNHKFLFLFLQSCHLIWYGTFHDLWPPSSLANFTNFCHHNPYNQLCRTSPFPHIFFLILRSILLLCFVKFKFQVQSCSVTSMLPQVPPRSQEADPGWKLFC